jgi:Cellulase (glycosyl hydrolase family 5)
MEMVRRISGIFCAFLIVLVTLGIPAQAQPRQTTERWSETRANDWYARQPWLVGSNYVPATAVNELEMWQAESFDPKRIDLEFGWAQAIGLNTMRVFLHDLPWRQDAAGYQKRIDDFLVIADRHHIRILFVLFDSVWDPNPRLGKQPDPRPGVHNSRWVQSPGAAALQDPAQIPRLETYVKGVVGAFANDPRIVGWDVWNEPSNVNTGNYDDLPGKKEIIRNLLPQVFAWAREAGASQPLTSGVWDGDWSSPETLDPIERIQIEQSDIVSFHNYGPPAEFAKIVRELKVYHRPILCTEYMARPNRSTFQGILPIAKKERVAAINWGLVAGKTQTYLPWDSWKHPYVDHPPEVWFHEIFRTDGTPYSPEETNFIRKITNGK